MNRPARRPSLSPRQEEILRLSGRGLPDREIGRQLGISAHTVNAHVRVIFQKLGARSRPHAIGLWFRR